LLNWLAFLISCSGGRRRHSAVISIFVARLNVRFAPKAAIRPEHPNVRYAPKAVIRHDGIGRLLAKQLAIPSKLNAWLLLS
jgi:hypothetical protein